MSELTFIHLTDLHILASKSDLLHGQSTVQRTQKIIDRVRSLEVNPDFILVSGDLVDNGTIEEYQLCQSLLRQLDDLGCPVLLGLGNHDKRLPFRKVFLNEDEADEARPYYHSTMINGLNVIMLDTVIPNHGGGTLDTAQLTWLAQELEQPAEVGHLIAMHHPPVTSTVRFLNTIRLANGADLAAVIQGKNVLGVLSGHIHYVHTAHFAGTLAYTSCASAYTIDPTVQDNLRATDGSGFAVGSIRQGQLFMNPIIMEAGHTELLYENRG